MSKTVAFKTLGCRLNLYETDSLASEFAKRGYDIVKFGKDCDVTVINTCTVTSMSDQKSRRVLHQANRKKGDGIVVVTGCMATHYKEQLEQGDDVDYVIDNDHKATIVDVVDAHFKGEHFDIDAMDKDVFNYDPADETFHTRSFIKIQDGCNNFCTYCIIPMVRGRAISRPAEDVLNNIRKVVEYGYKEVIITGVNIGHYDDNGLDFEHLVEKMLDIPGDFRIRISSIEPEGYTESFFRLFKNPKLAPHMHICLQSGSETILKMMNRKYTAKLFKQMAFKLEELYPGFSLTTDIIVGFPGETEELFKETVAFAKELNFAHIHTFKYSKREGTRAVNFPDHVDEKEKNRRGEIIRNLSAETRQAHRQRFVGQKQRILTQKFDENGFAIGYSEYYIPVIIKETELKKNTFYDVEIVDIVEKNEPFLIGRRIFK